MKSYLARRAVARLLAAALVVRHAPTPAPALAIGVQPRSEQETLERTLYSAAPPEIQTYSQQLGDAILVKSMRGVWRIREYGPDGTLTASGTLTFRGADSSPDKGQVVYTGEASSGRGPWILKPDGFGRSPTGKGGIIEQKALWKLRRGAQGTLVYAGRVSVSNFVGDRPDAVVRGPVVQLINGGIPKGDTEKTVGRFEAELLRFLIAGEELAAADSAAAGGAPEVLLTVCIAATSVRCE